MDNPASDKIEDTPLAVIIRERIQANGPMPLSDYMGLCLGHPAHGYYMSRDPFGKDGDFTTAPEVSQMFGEMIGAWVVDTWDQMGRPSPFMLLELGPGRGTLMADIIRVASKVPDFMEAVKIHLLEMSSVLQKAQAQTLSDFDPVWHKTLESVDPSLPFIAIGNEFLDALPVDQYVSVETGWAKKYVDINIDGTFRITEKQQDSNNDTLINLIPSSLFSYKLGDCVEVSHELNEIMNDLMKKLIKQRGSLLLIDYGFTHNGCGDTLQAVKNHAYVDILDSPGECDLTAHVNFALIAEAAMSKNTVVHGPVAQGAFLQALGIDVRADILKQAATEEQRRDIDAALERLIGKDQMGDLFKVIAISADPQLNLAGFSHKMGS